MKTYTPQQQAANAIKWIDELPKYKQAPFGMRGKLGSEKKGYCCLGAGCVITKTRYMASSSVAPPSFESKVGLLGRWGQFRATAMLHSTGSLADLNDRTEIGFEGIANVMKEHPDYMFLPEVAEIIREHYKAENP